MIDELLSQEEINALLQGHTLKTQEESGGTLPDVSPEQSKVLDGVNDVFSTAVTNVFGMLAGRSVTVPQKKQEVLPQKDFVLKPGEGAFCFRVTCQGLNDTPLVVVLAEHGALILADLMMGGEGKELPNDASELYLNAAQEGLSQMVGASLTNMSGILGGRRLMPDNATSALEKGEWLPFSASGPEENIWSIEYPVTIEGVGEFPLWILTPFSAAKYIADEALAVMSPAESQQAKSNVAPPKAVPSGRTTLPRGDVPAQENAPRSRAASQVSQVEVRPAEFMPLVSKVESGQVSSNIDLIADIPVRVTVELGRTRKSISEILNMTPGSVIELDKMAGEPVDILVNSKLLARGEVVVIDENFGVRITEIVNTSGRSRTL